jgi:hypothetical protein
VLVIVAELPAASAPIAQGYDVVHAPLLETNVSPAGVVSETVVELESDGPLFMTVTV